MKYIEKLIDKHSNGENLSEIQKFDLGLFYTADKKLKKLEEDIFYEFNFIELLKTYFEDLTFKSDYYKRTYESNISDIIPLYYLKFLNNINDLTQLEVLNKILLAKNYYKIASSDEVSIDKEILKNYTVEWAKEMSKQNHRDPFLQAASVETREIITLKKLNLYLRTFDLETFKSLIKSYYSYIESKKTLESIANTEFDINDTKFKLNFLSYFHIFYGHFAELISSNVYHKNKTYHNTNIVPSELPELLNIITKYINTNHPHFDIKTEEKVFFELNSNLYVMFITPYKYDKRYFHLRTLFPFDDKNINSKYLNESFKTKKRYVINSYIKVYL